MLYKSKSFTFHDTPYTVNIHLPSQKLDKYPLLVVLDGERYENLFVDMVKLFGNVSDHSCVYPYAVVTISLKELGNNKARFYKSTRYHEEYYIIEKLKNKPFTYGGAEEYQKFLEEVILKYVYDVINVKDDKKVIFGHSLTGLYLLHQISTSPKIFTDYIIMSPSVWWNDREALSYDYSLLSMSNSKVWVSTGALEGDLTEDIITLSNVLPSENTTVKIFNEENHLSIVHASIHSAFRYVYDEIDHETYVRMHSSKIKK